VTHVVADLELYALGALPADASERVARHLAVCTSCRTRADDVADVVALLPDALVADEPPKRLRARILESARADRGARGRWFTLSPRLRRGGVSAVLALVALALLAVDVRQTLALRAAQEEHDAHAAVARSIANGGRSWYMIGVERWRGAAGELVQPAAGERAFALFYALPDLPADQTYALWLISSDGRWVRGATFRPYGQDFQAVRLALGIEGFERCAVTVERGDPDARQGPLVMESAIDPETW
jgi:hypothetical protein